MFFSPLICKPLIGVSVMLCALTTVQANGFPTAPIRLVIPFPPGGGADAVGRMLAQKLAARLGQPVVVDNRAGANGSIGTSIVAKAPADGYTLLFTDRGALGINPSLYKSLAYDPLKDFAYVGIAARSEYMLVQRASLPTRSVSALVTAAKGTSCKLNYASFGTGSMPQLGMESFNAHYGTCITHVPYKGGGPALSATIAGEVDMTLVALSPALPHIKSGRLIPIAIGGAQRSSLLPQVPSITEAAGPATLFPSTWFGFAYPQKTPAAIVKRLSEDIQQVLALPDVRERLQSEGFEIGSVDPVQMDREVDADVRNFARELDRIGIRPE